MARAGNQSSINYQFPKMHIHLRRYGFALLVVLAAAAVRVALIPVLGYRYGFGFLLISTLVCGRYIGLGPSVFALLAGTIPPIVLHFIPPGQHFDSSFQVVLVVYLILGAIVVFLCNSEHKVRCALQRQIVERKAVEVELRESRQQLLMAIEAGRLGTWQLDMRTNRVQWSALMEPMHGYAPGTFGGTLNDAIANNHPDDRELILRDISNSSDVTHRTYRVIRADGQIRWIQGIGQTIRDESGQPVQMLGVCSDVTEQKQAADALRASENRLQAILNNTSAVIYLKDWQGRYLMVNRRFEELFGISRQQIIGKTDADVFPSEVVAKLQANDRRVRDTGQSLEFEEVVPHGDVSHTYVSVKFPIYDAAGQCNAVGGISTDISDRKRAADALEAEQELLRHTIEIQDHERQLITYEIHDGLVQYATGALLQLEAMRGHVESQAIAEQIDNVMSILQRAVAEGRRLIDGIRTPVLDDWGVVAAVQHLIDEEDRAHVQTEFVKDDGLGRMAPNIEEALYRITQEALTNVRKHSQAKKVRIEIVRRGDRVRLEVRDWGVGFIPSNGSKKVHGLRGMTNRAKLAGGGCTVESTPGKGTQIVVELPYLSRN